MRPSTLKETMGTGQPITARLAPISIYLPLNTDIYICPLVSFTDAQGEVQTLVDSR